MISKKKLRSFILVFCQFACLFLLIYTGPPYSKKILLSIMQFSGIILGIWAFFALSLKNLNIGPELRQNGF
jgi:succinate-acetate transporter protein